MPVPADAIDSCLALPAATRSASVLNGASCRTITTTGWADTSTTGVKSRTASYGILG
ncbi:hypothetical protein D3C85_1522890 [compost metagenome]